VGTDKASSVGTESFQPSRPLTGAEYLSRAVVGVISQRDSSDFWNTCHDVTVSCTWVSVDIRPRGRNICWNCGQSGPTEEFFADKVLLATGLPARAWSRRERDQAFAAATRGPPSSRLLSSSESMSAIPAGARVAMKGVGLTSSMAVLELTEGRAGRFEAFAGGHSLTRQRQDRRQSSPSAARSTDTTPKAWDQPLVPRPLTFFVPDATGRAERSNAQRQGRLRAGPLPLFELEMELNYYRVRWERTAGAHGWRPVAQCRAMAPRHRFLLAEPSRTGRFDYRQVRSGG